MLGCDTRPWASQKNKPELDEEDDEKAFHQKEMENELRKMKLPWVANKGNKLSMAAKKSTAKDSASRLGLTTLLAKSKNVLERRRSMHERKHDRCMSHDGEMSHRRDSGCQ